MMDDELGVVYLMPFLEYAASQAAVIIELGSGNGNGSTRAFARGIAKSTKPDKLFLSVDNDPTHPVERPDLDYWAPIYGSSIELATIRAAADVIGPRCADIIFIDTIHEYGHMKAEHELWSALADENTTWLYHDTWIWGPYNPMTEAAKEFAAANGLLYEDVSTLSHGLGMVSKAGHPDWPRPEGVDSQCPKL